MKKKLSGLSQAFIIFIMAIVVGLTINATSSQRVPFYTNYTDKMKLDNTDSIANVYRKSEEFKNNPYDTTVKSKPLNNNPNRTEKGFVTPQKINIELAKLLYDKNALMIDARPADQFAAGHIKGALNIPYEDFIKLKDDEQKEKMKKFNKDGIIIAYCNGGECDMSIDLAYSLAKIGFNATNIYLGGYKEWEGKGFPVEK